MADDQPQRPYRSALPPTRGPAASTAPAGSDPLAELARLIGQNDPFAEFGRDSGRQADPAATSAPRQNEAALDWPPQTQHRNAAGQAPAAPPLADAQQFGAGSFGQPPFVGDQYQPETDAPAYDVPGYPPQPAGGEFGYDAYQQTQDPNAYPGQDPNQGFGYGQYGAEDDDYYDDVPSNRRRIGIIAIAGVFALAVIGTAGAFGYRAIFGSSASSGPPPVIKADTTPSKIVPATAGKDAQAGKMITDRVNDRGEGEKLVSREEQPVPVTPTKPPNVIFPQSQGQNPAAAAQLGSGIVGTAPKRIRTIVIHPDQASGANPASAAPEAPPMQPPPAAEPEPQPQPRAARPASAAAQHQRGGRAGNATTSGGDPPGAGTEQCTFVLEPERVSAGTRRPDAAHGRGQSANPFGTGGCCRERWLCCPGHCTA